MQSEDFHIAKIEGGVFFDRLPTSDWEAVYEDLRTDIKHALKSSGLQVEIKPEIGDQGLAFEYRTDKLRRRFAVTVDKLGYEAGAFPVKSQPPAEIGLIIEAMLARIKRADWNRVGTNIGIALPSRRESEETRFAIDFFRSEIAPSFVREQHSDGELAVLDLTAKWRLKKQTVTMNVFNTLSQDIVVSQDVQIDYSDLLELQRSASADCTTASISAFIQNAFEMFKQQWITFAANLASRDELKSHIDFQYLKSGTRD